MPVSFVEQNADLAAFLWHRRDAAAVAPHHDLRSLTDLDDRVEAHLDALLVAGERGAEVVMAAVDEEDAGTVFAAAVTALGRRDHRAFAALLTCAGADLGLSRALVSALGWVPVEVASPVLTGLLSARAAPLRRIGVGGSAAHRRDPGEALASALLQEDAALRARALLAVGELGRADLLGHVREELSSSEVRCRFAAAWSGALLGEEAAYPLLGALAAGDGPRAEVACDLACRLLRPNEARALILGLRRDHPRAALVGAAALGDPALIPLLLEALEIPDLARFAAEALATVTGIEIERGLAGEPPEGFSAAPNDDPADPRVTPDPDEKLPWPAPRAVLAAWEGGRAGFAAGTRYLQGKPLSPGWAAEVLRSGRQRRRAGAALELALGRRGAPLFEVRARGERQAAMLGVRG